MPTYPEWILSPHTLNTISRISNAQTLMAKSFRNAPKNAWIQKGCCGTASEWEKFLVDRTKPRTSSPYPSFRFNWDHFHYPISHNSSLAYKVNIQRVDTQYSCAICGVCMCPDPNFMRHHTMVDYYLTMKAGKVHQDWGSLMVDPGFGQEGQENCIVIHIIEIFLTLTAFPE